MSARVLVLLAACLSSSTALKCYLCSSNDGEYCSDTEIHKGRIEPAECPQEVVNSGRGGFDSIARALGIDYDGSDNYRGSSPTRNRVPLACQKIYHTNPGGRGYTERKCVVRDAGACRFAGDERIYGRMDYCGLCFYDGCNGAGQLGGNYFWLLPLLAALLQCW